jgi:hypothetical protein
MNMVWGSEPRRQQRVLNQSESAVRRVGRCSQEREDAQELEGQFIPCISVWLEVVRNHDLLLSRR